VNAFLAERLLLVVLNHLVRCASRLTSNRRSMFVGITCLLLAGCGAATTGSSPSTAVAKPASAAPASVPVASASAAALAPASAASANPAASSAAKPAASGLQKVRYGELRILGDAGIYIAVEQGYFAQQGIELELVPFDSAVNMIPPLGTGEISAGGGAMSAGLWNAVNRGIELKVVADKGHLDNRPPGFPVADLLVRKDLWDSGKVKSVADLKGLTLTTPAKGFTGEITASKELAKGGLKPTDVTFVTVPLPDTASAFANKKVDAGGATEPSRTIIVEQQQSAVLLMHDYDADPGAQTAGILFGPSFAASPLAAPFATAYLQGVRTYNDGFVKKNPAAREKAIDALVKHTAVKDRSLFDRMSIQGLDPDGKLNEKSMDEQQDFWVEHNEQQKKIDLAKVVDNQIAKAAVAKLGPYK
jgi:NitT/TauT family transport system substrate-binding protein